MKNKSKNMEFPTKYTESVKKGSFEVFTKPTKTEPDNSMSIPQIIARFTRGQGISVQQHIWETGVASEGGIYPQDEDWHDVVPGLPAPQQTPQETPIETPQETPKE